jgi:hypothetical protein
MATDPVRRIREHTYSTPFDFNIDDPLVHLAQLPPSTDVPYLTVSLDWRPDEQHPGRRAARTQFEKETAALIANAGPRGDVLDSLAADVKRISAYLDNEVDAAAQGVFIVANSAHGVFEPLILGLPVPTFILSEPTPQLTELARLADDHPTYAVLVADQRDAFFTLVTQANRDQRVYIESSLYPAKQKTGGNAERRYRARAGERVAAFAKVLAAEIKSALADAGVNNWVMAGDEVITSALATALDAGVRERMIAHIRLAITATPQEVIAATFPLVTEVERAREAAAVDRLHENLGGGRAVAGAIDVANALLAKRVDLLVITDDYQADGWADYTLGTFGVGEKPAEHPTGGDVAALVDIDLDEEFVRLALASGAEIEIVHSRTPIAPDDGTRVEAGQPMPKSDAATRLDEIGGVGALLRY